MINLIGKADWVTKAACRSRDVNPDWWTSTDCEEQGQAIWICRNACTVREECLHWAEDHPDLVDQAVYGGVYWTRGGHHPDQPPSARPSGHQPAVRSPDEVFLGKYEDGVRELVEDGVSYRDIADTYGVPMRAVTMFVGRNRRKWMAEVKP